MTTKPKKRPLSAAHWARCRYARAFARSFDIVRSADSHTELLQRPKVKAGLPADLPQFTVGGNGPPDTADRMQALERAYVDGYGAAALHAIADSFMWTPAAEVPGWARAALVDALYGWQTHRYSSLEDAFNTKRARSKRDDAHFANAYGGQIFLDVADAKIAGVAVNNRLFAEIGRAYKRSAKTVERVYSAHAATVTKKVKSDG